MVGSSYQTILKDIEDKTQMCHAGPVIQVPHKSDIMMHTRNCKRVHSYLNDDLFDMELLDKMMREEFGSDNVDRDIKVLEKHFKKEIKNLRDYFSALDGRVAELKQLGGGSEMINFQRQECFILANNFVGDPKPGLVYLSKMVVPFANVLSAKVVDDLMGEGKSSLKYLVFNLHDTNISNLLRFLGFWDKYGYFKHVRYASSVRFEIIKRKDWCLDLKKTEEYPEGNPFVQYKLRIVYDDEEIHLPFCQEKYCLFEEFGDYIMNNLIVDLKEAEEYCNS